MCIVREAMYKVTQSKACYISIPHRQTEETSHTGHAAEEHLPKKSKVAAMKLSSF